MFAAPGPCDGIGWIVGACDGIGLMVDNN